MTDTFRKVYKTLKQESTTLIQEMKNQAEVLEGLMTQVKSREMSLAITNLEQAMMWGTKAIVLNDKKISQEDGA